MYPYILDYGLYTITAIRSIGGGVPLTTPLFYSAGATDDTRQALMHISHLYPRAPLLGLAFSLGSAVMTRYLAEEGSNSRLQSACVLACVSFSFFEYEVKLSELIYSIHIALGS